MARAWSALALTLAVGLPAGAGGVFYNSNQSAEYIRSFDRNSAIDNADIAYYNMAGTVALRPGLSLNLSNQTLLQWATVRTLGNPVLGGRSCESRNPVWCLPNAYAVYRWDRWAVFTGLESIAASAVRRWPQGLPSLDLAGKKAAGYGGPRSQQIAADAYAAALGAGASPAQARAAAAAAGLDASAFPSGSWLTGSSRVLAWRHGAARRMGPRWSLALAGRLVYARQEITGGAWGACSYGQYSQEPGSRIPVAVTRQALGYSLESGLDLFPADGLVLSLSYEMATGLRFRTAVRDGQDGGGQFVDGSRAHLDLPQVWRFGIGWQAGPRLRLSAGLNGYLEHAARMDLLDNAAARIVARRDYGNTWEESAALEWRLGPRWLWSLGCNVNQIGQHRPATLDVSLPGAHADYFSLGTGFQLQASSRYRFNFGLAATGFIHRYAWADVQGDQALQGAFAAQGAAISPRKEYDKRYLILAFGVDCHFPR